MTGNLYDDLLYEPVTEFMEPRYSRVVNSDPAQKAVQALLEDPDHVVIVTDDEFKFTGMIDEQAIKQKFDEHKTAKDLATTDRDKLVGVRARAKLGQLLRLMSGENKLKRPVSNVPVLDEQDRVVGLVNRDRLDKKLKLLARAAYAY